MRESSAKCSTNEIHLNSKVFLSILLSFYLWVPWIVTVLPISVPSGVVLAISIDIVNLQLPALGQDQEGAESSSSFLLFEEGSEDILARGTSSPRRNHCPSEN